MLHSGNGCSERHTSRNDGRVNRKHRLTSDPRTKRRPNVPVRGLVEQSLDERTRLRAEIPDACDGRLLCDVRHAELGKRADVHPGVVPRWVGGCAFGFDVLDGSVDWEVRSDAVRTCVDGGELPRLSWSAG